MLRLAIPLALLVACDWTEPDTGPPDANRGCAIGTYRIVAPIAGQHYDSALHVYIDEAELQGELTLVMLDESGTAYNFTSDTYGPDPNDSFLTLDDYIYALAPGHRYELTVSHCDDSQTVTFFTSP